MADRASFKTLQKQLPRGELILDQEECARYGGDKWFARATPEAVALPGSTESVRRILAFANRRGVPVTARGAGYG